MTETNQRPYIFRPWIRTKSGQIIFAREYGKKAFKGICDTYLSTVEGEMSLGGICLVAGLGPETNLRRDGSYEYYMSEPIVKDDAKGTAPFLLAYAEMLRLEA